MSSFEWLYEADFVKYILRPGLDILVLAFLIYQGYKILVQTRAIPLIRGVIIIALLWLLAYFLRLDTLRYALDLLAPGIFIGFAILFQPEFRRIITQIGQGAWFSSPKRPQAKQVDAVLNAVEVLSGMRRGALISFVRSVGLKSIVDRGTPLGADISSAMVLTIFGHDTPLHDGGIIIERGKIVSGGCFYPLSDQSSIKKSFGTRHRAALGLAEESDAVTIIVSEETGAVSMAYNSTLYYDLSLEEVRSRLRELLDFREAPEEVVSEN
jgi:diadenylate cyclase